MALILLASTATLLLLSISSALLICGDNGDGLVGAGSESITPIAGVFAALLRPISSVLPYNDPGGAVIYFCRLLMTPRLTDDARLASSLLIYNVWTTVSALRPRLAELPGTVGYMIEDSKSHMTLL